MEVKGVIHALPHGYRSLVQLKLGADGAPCPTGSLSKNVTGAVCSTRQEAAAGRDILQLWLQHLYAKPYTAPDFINRCTRNAPFMARLCHCQSPVQVRDILKELRDDGELAKATEATKCNTASSRPSRLRSTMTPPPPPPSPVSDILDNSRYLAIHRDAAAQPSLQPLANTRSVQATRNWNVPSNGTGGLRGAAGTAQRSGSVPQNVIDDAVAALCALRHIHIAPNQQQHSLQQNYSNAPTLPVPSSYQDVGNVTMTPMKRSRSFFPMWLLHGCRSPRKRRSYISPRMLETIAEEPEEERKNSEDTIQISTMEDDHHHNHQQQQQQQQHSSGESTCTSGPKPVNNDSLLLDDKIELFKRSKRNKNQTEAGGATVGDTSPTGPVHLQNKRVDLQSYKDLPMSHTIDIERCEQQQQRQQQQQQDQGGGGGLLGSLASKIREDIEAGRGRLAQLLANPFAASQTAPTTSMTTTPVDRPLHPVSQTDWAGQLQKLLLLQQQVFPYTNPTSQVTLATGAAPFVVMPTHVNFTAQGPRDDGINIDVNAASVPSLAALRRISSAARPTQLPIPTTAITSGAATTIPTSTNRTSNMTRTRTGTAGRLSRYNMNKPSPCMLGSLGNVNGNGNSNSHHQTAVAESIGSKRHRSGLQTSPAEVYTPAMHAKHNNHGHSCDNNRLKRVKLTSNGLSSSSTGFLQPPLSSIVTTQQLAVNHSMAGHNSNAAGGSGGGIFQVRQGYCPVITSGRL